MLVVECEPRDELMDGRTTGRIAAAISPARSTNHTSEHGRFRHHHKGKEQRQTPFTMLCRVESNACEWMLDLALEYKRQSEEEG